MKQNDWIVAGINNPEFNASDYRNILGMDESNTQLLSAAEYEQSDFITSNPAFQKEDGTFDKDRFEDYYRNKALEFGQFNQSEPLLDNFEYSLFDTRQKANSKVKDADFQITRVSNPDRITVGIAGRNVVGDRKWTPSELAQTQQVFDSSTGQFSEDTLNDRALITNPLKWLKDLFSDPVVLAQYDEAGEHINPITGQVETHQKGDYKLNADGQYYAETLNGRSPIGKQVVSAFDLLTVDGSGINKYDFIDSDSLDKSVTGSVAKAALKVAPLFMGPVGVAYSGALVARELAKSLPMLYGMASSLFGNEQDSAVLNTIAAFGDKFSTGTSEYAQQHTFAFENFANLMSDVAVQWGQQKAIAKGISRLRGGKDAMTDAYKQAGVMYRNEAQKILNEASLGRVSVEEARRLIGSPENWAESAIGKAALKKVLPAAEQLAQRSARLGADASLAYMAIISNTDVYSSLLEAGASKRDAALVAFGSTLGMFGVDRYLGLGEIFFDDLTSESERAIRGTFKKEADSWASTLVKDGITNPAETGKNKILSRIQKGIALGKNATSKFAEDLRYHSLGFLGKAVGEGLEEVSEEVVTDLSKQFYEIAGQFGPNFFNKSQLTDVGAWDNAGERYLMNFLGGAAGGGIFYGVEQFQNGGFKHDASKDELIYLVSNHRTPELLEELEKWRKHGKLGSTTLSATKYDKDTHVYLTADDDADTQNEFVYNRLKETILSLENTLNENKVNLSEDELFKQMVLGEDRFMLLQQELQGASYSTGYQQEFRNLVSKLITAENDLKMAEGTVNGRPDGKALEDADKRDAAIMGSDERSKNIEAYRQGLADIRNQLAEFTEGKKSLEYTEKMLFAIDPNLRKQFISMTFEDWVSNNYDGKKISDLTAAEKAKATDDYLQYKASKQALDLTQQFSIYKSVKSKVDPYIQGIAENAGAFANTAAQLQHLLSEDGPIAQFTPFTWDDMLEGETEEQFNLRNKQEGEIDEDYKVRANARLARINELNQMAMQQLYDGVQDIITKSGGAIDPTTRRNIHQLFNERSIDVVNSIFDERIGQIERLGVPAGLRDGVGLRKKVESIVRTLAPDGSNLAEVRKQVTEAIKAPFEKDLNRRNFVNEKLRAGFHKMLSSFGYTKNEEDITGADISNFMTDLAIKIAAKDPDIKAKFEALDLGSVYETLQSSEDVLSELYDTDAIATGDESFLESYFGEDAVDVAGNNIFENLIQNLNTIRTAENPAEVTYSVLSEADLAKRAEQLADVYNDSIQNIISGIAEDFSSNLSLKLFNLVDSAVSNINPIRSLIDNVTKQVLGNTEDLDTILDALHAKIEGLDSKDSFSLTDAEESTLRQAEYILNLTASYLYAASTEPNYQTPVGHNKTLNDFVANHRDVYGDVEPLPTLPSDVATMYIQEINKYLAEISEQSPISLISLSNRNKVNKRQRFIETDKAFTATKKELFHNARDAFKDLTIDGKVVDLMEGADMFDSDDPEVDVHNLENTLFKNVHRLISSGVSMKSILQQTGLLEKLVNFDKLALQQTTGLDRDITYGKLTDFDKLVYLVSILGISSNDFQNFIKSRIDEEENLVPISVQQYNSRLALAMLENKQVVHDILDYYQEKSGNPLPMLKNVLFVDGSAGAGKTISIAKNAAKYISNDDDLWLSTPENTQLKTLRDTIGRGDTFVRKDLFEKILDKATYKEIMDDIEAKNTASKWYSVESLPGTTNKAYHLKADAITFADVKAPKLLIIDEVTHFSGLELQLLDAWANAKGVTIIGLGDTNQNGFSGMSRNVDRETIFMLRTPKLTISLRDTNIQQQTNLQLVSGLLTTLQSLEDTDPDYKEQVRNIRNATSKLNLRVYNQETINGELITPTLTQELVDKLYVEEGQKIGYVGKSRDALNLLKAKFGDDVVELQETEIQGQEFTFVVVDKNWTLHSPEEDANGVNLLGFLQDLYTMMSRGRVGAIFMDNGLSDIIGKNKEEFNKALAPNLLDALAPFKESNLALLERLGLVPKEEFLNSYKSTPVAGPTPTTTESPEVATEPEAEPTNFEYEGTEDTEDAEVNTEEVKKEITEALDDGKMQNAEEALNEETLLTGEVPIRAYGSAHLNGMVTKTVKVDDKDVNYWVSNEMISPSDINFDSLNFENFVYTGVLITGNEERNRARTISFSSAEDLNNFINTLADKETDYNLAVLELNKEAVETPPTSEAALNEILSRMGIADNPDFVTKFVVSSNPVEQTRRDLGIFADSFVYKSAQEKDAIVRKLLALKSAILYKHDYDSLPASVRTKISAAEYNDMKFMIEVRPLNPETDKFVGFTGLDDSKLGFNGLVYSVVAKLGTKTVTLGLLADPVTYENAGPALVASIDKQIERLDKSKPDYAATVAKLRDRQTNVIPGHIAAYKQLFEDITKAYTESGKEIFTFAVNPNFSALTYLRRVTTRGNTRTKVPVRPLEGISTDLAGRVKDRAAGFIATHPYTVVSEPYIYIGKGFNGISDANRGKAVVFVSNDTLLQPDELITEYINEKEANNAENTNAFSRTTPPRVRMVILNPRGVAFRDLAFRKYRDLFRTSQKTADGKNIVKSLPFEEDYMGARMYVAMWNWRTNLQRFMSEYSKFKEKNGLKDEDVIRIATYADAKYLQSEGNSSPKIDDALSHPATDAEVKLITDFNNSLAATVRQFRIGGSLDQRGFYIRKLTNIAPENTFYDVRKGNPLGVYINPLVATKFLNFTDSLFKDFLDKFISLKTTDGTPWDSNKLITTKTKDGKNYQNSLSNLLREAFAPGSTGFEVEEDGQVYSISMPGKRAVTFVPIVMRDLYKRIKSFQMNEDDVEISPITITGTPKEDGTPGENIVMANYSGFMDNVTKYDGVNLDTSFDDFMSLMFHGTTADLEGDAPRATDAYFKHGFYVDPIGGVNIVENSAGSAMFKPLLNHKAMFKVDCEVDMPVFDVTISDMAKGLTDSTKTPEPSEEGFIPSEQLLDKLENSGIITPDMAEELAGVTSEEEFISLLNTRASEALAAGLVNKFKNHTKLEVLADVPVAYDANTDTVTTFQKYIKDTLDRDIDKTFNSVWNGDELRVFLNDSETAVISFNFATNKLTASIEQKGDLRQAEEAGTTLDEVSNAKQIIKDWYASLPAEDKSLYEDTSTTIGAQFKKFMRSYQNFTTLDAIINPIAEFVEEWGDGDNSIMALANSLNNNC